MLKFLVVREIHVFRARLLKLTQKFKWHIITYTSYLTGKIKITLHILLKSSVAGTDTSNEDTLNEDTLNEELEVP